MLGPYVLSGLPELTESGTSFTGGRKWYVYLGLT